MVGIADLLDAEDWRNDLSQPVLNAWLARGAGAPFAALRLRLIELLSEENYRDEVRAAAGRSKRQIRASACRAWIGDYTDFYVGIHHATDVGKQFRPDNPLLPKLQLDADRLPRPCKLRTRLG